MVNNLENKLEYFTVEMALEADFMVKREFIRKERERKRGSGKRGGGREGDRDRERQSHPLCCLSQLPT